jgi:hypothetical protein
MEEIITQKRDIVAARRASTLPVMDKELYMDKELRNLDRQMSFRSTKR